MSNDPLRQQVPGAVREVAQSLTMPVLNFVFDWFKWSLPWLAAISILILGVGYLRQVRDVPISFLTGPRGGDGANQTKRLLDEFDDHSPLQRNYFVTSIYTDGFVDNYHRVDADSKGRLTGYAMDGLPNGRAVNVQTILPMEWEYLHFAVRTDSLKKLDPKWDNKDTVPLVKPVNFLVKPVNFSEWAQSVRLKYRGVNDQTTSQSRSDSPICIYLGPRGSGTRSVAEVVLEFAKIPVTEVEAIGIADFREILPALRQKKIDGAFFVGPFGSGTAKLVAEDKEAGCTLISMDIADKLAKKHAYLVPGIIPASTYSIPGDGRLDEVQTFAVRRVLVASRSMDANHAFRIAEHVQKVLPHRVPKRLANGLYPGPDGSPLPLIFDEHRGIWSTESVTGPLTWIDRHAFWLVPLLLTMLVAVIGAWKPEIVSWLDRHRPRLLRSDDSAQSLAPKQVGIAAEIGRILKDMHDTEDQLIVENQAANKATLDNWRKQIADVYRRIHAESQAQTLSAGQSLALKEGAYQLQQELEFLRNPPWHEEPTRKRSSLKQNRNQGGKEDTQDNAP